MFQKLINRNLLVPCNSLKFVLRTKKKAPPRVPTYYNQTWRKERGLPLNPNSCGVLTDSVDYAYFDGRLTPYGVGQKERIIREKEVLNQIIQFTGEIDFAVERHKTLVEQEAESIKTILDNKLKPKGLLLNKQK